MRILVLNPNTTASVTDLVVASGTAVAAPGTELVAATAPRGLPYIVTRAEAAISGAVALDMLAGAKPEPDAAIIAAFGDPGLLAARELFDFPVVGLAEAGMLAACMLGRRFAIISFAAAMKPWYLDCVEMHGLQSRLAGIRALKGGFQSISAIQEEKEQLLIDLALEAVELDDADVIVLAGAPLSGLATKVRDRLPVPLVDCAAAAVKMAEGLVGLRLRKATAGGFRHPGPRDSMGLDEDLARRLAFDPTKRMPAS